MEFSESLSPYYDLIFPTDAETVSFLDGLVDRGARILDLACGTGGYSLALAGRGHRLTGIDLDRSMVEAAREKSRRQGLPSAPRFAVMDMLDIETELGAGFDDLQLYGGFDRRPFSLDALPLVLCARRG